MSIFFFLIQNIGFRPHEIGAFELISNMPSSEIFRMGDQDDLTDMSVFRAEVLLGKPLDSAIFDSERVEV